MSRLAWLVAWVACTACGRIGFEQTALEREPDAKVARQDAGAPAPDGGDGDMDAAIDDAAIDDAAIDDAAIDDAAIDDDDAGAIDDDDAGVAPLPDGDFCEAIARLAQRPVIDGVLEPGLALRSAPALGWTSGRPLPTGREAAYALGYHDEGIYVFVSVTDSTRLPSDDPMADYCGDGVEIYLDADGLFMTAPDYDLPGTIQFIIAAPVDDSTESTRGSRWSLPPNNMGPWLSSNFRAVPTADGYAVEALIVGDDLGLPAWAPVAGQDVGLALSVNVAEVRGDPDADCGHRLGQYFNRLSETPRDGWCSFPFCTTDAFCVAPLQP